MYTSARARGHSAFLRAAAPNAMKPRCLRLPQASGADEKPVERSPRKPGRRGPTVRPSWLALLLLALPARADEPGDRVFADSFITWIYPQPSFDRPPIGYLRGGTSIALGPGDAVRGAGCSGGFRAVQPTGYVCVGQSASLTETRYAKSLAMLAPKGGAFPFDYALSMGSPAYRRLPGAGEVRRNEAKFGPPVLRPLPPHWEGHEELARGQHPEGTRAPSFLLEQGSASRLPEDRLIRREIPFGSMIAVTGAFEHEGRSYLQSADGTIVPAERFRSFRRSTFAGVELSGDVALPLAWTRRKSTPRENACKQAAWAPSEPGRLDAVSPMLEGCLGAAREPLGVRTLVALSGRRQRLGHDTYVETKGGDWLLKRELFLAERPQELLRTSEKWIHFSIEQGTLLAFSGERAVFATLGSPGIGGRPRIGGDPLLDRTTPLGTFRIQFKHRTDDMSPEQTEHRAFFIADVPHALFFQPPFAIHVAYWHESFGEPMSGGCINVSPEDGARLFDWTDPPLPTGWHGVSSGAGFGAGTWVRVAVD